MLIKRELSNRELREQRGIIARQMSELVEGGIKTKEDMTRFNQLDLQQKGLRARIEALEGTGAPPNGQPGGAQALGVRREENVEHRKAFGQYLRRGAQEMDPDLRAVLYERRDMSEGVLGGAYPGSTSGFFVPVGFVQQVEDAMKYYGPMLDGGRGLPTIMDTETGQTMPYPAADDTANVGEQIGEGQQVTMADVNLSQVVFGAYKYSSKLVKVSIELLQDSAFDFDTWLTQEFAKRLGRIVNTKTTLGVGTSEPYGIVTAIVAGGNLVAAIGSSGNDGTSAGANTIGSDDLTNLEHAVDPLYRPGARYMMHDSTLKAIKKVKDKYGRPLFQESTRDGSPSTINGYEWVINNDMATLETNPSSPPVTRTTVVFGDLSKHVIRRVKQMSVLRLTERFADQGQVAFLAFARYDSQSIDISHRAQAALQNAY